MTTQPPCELGPQITGAALDGRSDLDVVLAAVKDVSLKGVPGIRSSVVRVSSLAAAAEMCSFFIKENHLGPENWAGGEVRTRAGNAIAFIGYTGRVWRLKTPTPFSFQPNRFPEPKPHA